MTGLRKVGVAANEKDMWSAEGDSAPLCVRLSNIPTPEEARALNWDIHLPGRPGPERKKRPKKKRGSKGSG